MASGAADRHLVLLLADWISWWEDAVVYRAGLPNKAGSLALRLWDKPDNFDHIRFRHEGRVTIVSRPPDAVQPIAAAPAQPPRCSNRILPHSNARYCNPPVCSARGPF